MNLFETTSVVGEDTLKEIKRYLMSPVRKKFFIAIIAICIYMSVFFCLSEIYTIAGLFALAAIGFTLEYHIIQNSYVKINLRRIQESINVKEYSYTSSFTEDGVKGSNHATNASAIIYYDNLYRLAETESFYTLFTKTNQFILINKNGLGGEPERGAFTDFLKDHCKNINFKHRVKMRNIMIVAICLASILLAVLYWSDGRTIFENRAAPSEVELATVHQIIAFEQQALSECRQLLSGYDDRAKALGIEIRPVLRQTRAVNAHGRVEDHDLNKELWLPKYYSSQIICHVYKDGAILEKQTSSSSTSYFVVIFGLVDARGNEDIVEFNEDPFNSAYATFDSDIDNLLERVSGFLQDEVTSFAKPYTSSQLCWPHVMQTNPVVRY